MICKDVLQLVNEANIDAYYSIGSFLKDNYIKLYAKFLSEVNWLKHKGYTKPIFVAWYLKLFLIWLVEDNGLRLSDEKINKKYVRLCKDLNVPVGYEIDFNSFKESISHYFGFGFEEVFSYDYSRKSIERVLGDLQKIVDFKQSKSLFLVNELDERKKLGDKFEDFIVFEDGWKWVWKHVDSCGFESEFGFHCGSAETEQETILSLREPSEFKDYYKIWASFSIDEDGFLKQRKGTVDYTDSKGQLKRVGNQKPAKITHKYIVELLKKDEISGFYDESDYKPELDFYLDDLTDSQIEDIEGSRRSPLQEISREDSNKSIEDKYFDGEINMREFVDRAIESDDFYYYAPDLFKDVNSVVRRSGEYYIKLCKLEYIKDNYHTNILGLFDSFTSEDILRYNRFVLESSLTALYKELESGFFFLSNIDKLSKNIEGRFSTGSVFIDYAIIGKFRDAVSSGSVDLNSVISYLQGFDYEQEDVFSVDDKAKAVELFFESFDDVYIDEEYVYVSEDIFKRLLLQFFGGGDLNTTRLRRNGCTNKEDIVLAMVLNKFSGNYGNADALIYQKLFDAVDYLYGK